MKKPTRIFRLGQTLLLLVLCIAIAGGVGLRRIAEVAAAPEQARIEAFVLAGGSRADLCHDAGLADPTALPCDGCKLLQAATLPAVVAPCPVLLGRVERIATRRGASLIRIHPNAAPDPARGPPLI